MPSNIKFDIKLMISLLSGQIIKISGPQFWKDKKWWDVQKWTKKWSPRSGLCPSRLLSYRTIISGYFFLVPGCRWSESIVVWEWHIGPVSPRHIYTNFTQPGLADHWANISSLDHDISIISGKPSWTGSKLNL